MENAVFCINVIVLPQQMVRSTDIVLGLGGGDLQKEGVSWPEESLGWKWDGLVPRLCFLPLSKLCFWEVVDK